MNKLELLQKKLDTLSMKRLAIAVKEADLRKDKADYQTLREEVLFDLQINKIETLKNDRITATVVNKPKFTVMDTKEIETWLLKHQFNVDEYKRLDTPMVTSLAEATMRETGEIVDGMTYEIDEILSVRDRKEKNGK